MRACRAAGAREPHPRRSARAKEEGDVIERWREEAGRGGRAASGWSETLEAASDERVEVLLYRRTPTTRPGSAPRAGGSPPPAGSARSTGREMERRDDGLDLAVHQTLAHGGTVWAITAHQDLDPVEGIGALLRY